MKQLHLQYKWIFAVILIGLFLVQACEEPKTAPATTPEKIDPAPQTTSEASAENVEEIAFFVVHYRLNSLATAAAVDSFKSKYSDEHLKYIYAINRIDANRLRAGNPMVIPDTLTHDFLDYAPFPKHLQLVDSLDKTVLISKRVQAFALYEHGKLKHWGPVSSGKQSTPTPAGLFYGNYKARSKRSTVDGSWILPYYFNFMNFAGVGVHQYAMPGYPASHACVRLREDDAIRIYDWAQQWKLDEKEQQVVKNGTPFMVYGEYDFKKPFPWLELSSNPHSNFISAAEMETLATYMEEYRNDPKNFEGPESLPSAIGNTANVDLETLL